MHSCIPPHSSLTHQHRTPSQDILPTVVALAGGSLPTDRTFDGLDMAPVLWKQAPSLHTELFFSVGGEVYNTKLPGQHARNPVPGALFEAVRTERWSAMYKVVVSVW